MPLQKINSQDLANYILATTGTMNHLKLQKLIYYVEAYHLAYFEESLIDDDFEAWLHGPVSRKIWDYYKDRANIYDHLSVVGDPETVKKVFLRTITEDQEELINEVLAEYGKESAYGLECMTHEEPPWQKAREGYSPDSKCEEIIQKSLMKKYYKQNIYP